MTHYKTEAAVRELLSLGNMSILAKTVETSVFYHRDRGEVDQGGCRFNSVDEWLSGYGQEFNYLFSQGHWTVDSESERWKGFVAAEEAIQLSEDM